MLNIEIIPNWHPLFVHFTIALLSISALMYLAGFVLKKPHLLLIARWNLWIGSAITIITVLAGFYAYSTVTHDGPSHAAMTDHKNWALVTALVFTGLGLWSVIKHRGAKTVGIFFVILMLSASSLLAVTGFKGGEAVYRYGLGVMSLPTISGDGGHGSHEHGNSNAGHHGAETKTPDMEEKTDGHGEHSH